MWPCTIRLWRLGTRDTEPVLAVEALHCGQLQADRLPPGATTAIGKDAPRGVEVHVELETENVVGRHEFGPADAVGPLRLEVLFPDHVQGFESEDFADIWLKRHSVGAAEFVRQLECVEAGDCDCRKWRRRCSCAKLQRIQNGFREIVKRLKQELC